MLRLYTGLAVVVATLGLGVAGYAGAQDEATPPAGEASPTEVLCATPLPVATGSPEMVVEAPTTAASPGGAAPGTPIGLFPCATPFDGTPTAG
jgi:hypothetical protein